MHSLFVAEGFNNYLSNVKTSRHATGLTEDSIKQDFLLPKEVPLPRELFCCENWASDSCVVHRTLYISYSHSIASLRLCLRQRVVVFLLCSQSKLVNFEVSDINQALVFSFPITL